MSILINKSTKVITQGITGKTPLRALFLPMKPVNKSMGKIIDRKTTLFDQAAGKQQHYLCFVRVLAGLEVADRV